MRPVNPRSARANVTVSLMGYVVKLRWSREWEEYCVSIQLGGRGVSLTDYHTPDYADARGTMAQEILRLRRQARAFDAARFKCACETCMGGQLCRAMCADCADARVSGNGVVCYTHAVGR